MSIMKEVILWMKECDPGRIAPNRTMLCIRNDFMLQNGRDISPDEYNAIIRTSGSAGIVKM